MQSKTVIEEMRVWKRIRVRVVWGEETERKKEIYRAREQMENLLLVLLIAARCAL